MHIDEIERLPDGGVLLATNRLTQVQAGEIRREAGVFWGVQSQPEISSREAAVVPPSGEGGAENDQPSGG